MGGHRVSAGGACARTRGGCRIEQWLLLAVRTLIVVLVVLAVAEPFLEQAGLNFVPGQRTLKVLVIDGSYSMALQADRQEPASSGPSSWPTQIVEESTQGDGFTLMLMAAPPAVIVGTPAFEPRDFLEEIDNLKLPHGGGDLPATLVEVEEVLPVGRARRADAQGSLFSHRPGPQQLGAANCETPRPRPNIASVWPAGQEAALVVRRPGPSGGRESGHHQSGRRRAVYHRRPRGHARRPGAQFRQLSARITTWSSSMSTATASRKPMSTRRRRASAVSFSLSLRSARRPRASSSAWRPICWTSTTIAGCRCRSRTICACCASTASRPAAAVGATDYLALALEPRRGQCRAAAALVKPEVVPESCAARARSGAVTTACFSATSANSPPAKPACSRRI